MEETVYLGLGSNLGDRVAHVCAGLDRLRKGGLRLRAVSSFYATEPDLGAPGDAVAGRRTDGRRRDSATAEPGRCVSPPAAGAPGRCVSPPAAGAPEPSSEQSPAHPWYVNCVASFSHTPSPRRLLELCQHIERDEGRERPAGARAGVTAEPRTLDIDILLFGGRVIDEPGLTVPHPRLAERRFVLQPLAEIAPDARHPLSGATARQMLASLPAGTKVELLRPQPRRAEVTC